jgi:hypothetical protein
MGYEKGYVYKLMDEGVPAKVIKYLDPKEQKEL